MSNFINTSIVWGLAITMCAFALGTYLHKRTNKSWCNPILLASILVILMLSSFDISYVEYKQSNSVLTDLLLPSTVSLAIPLYQKWELLKKNIVAIFGGIVAGVLVSIGSCILLAWIFDLDTSISVSILPKSVTTAIGIDIARELGGLPALTTTIIILTGIVGNLLAVKLCKMFTITHPVAKGIAIGTSSHAIGTSKALEIGEIEGAVSSLSIAVSGVLTAFLCPIVAYFLL